MLKTGVPLLLIYEMGILDTREGLEIGLSEGSSLSTSSATTSPVPKTVSAEICYNEVADTSSASTRLSLTGAVHTRL